MPKRADGEGSWTRLTNGTYQFRISVTFLDGSKVRKSFYGRTRREARERAERYRTESGRVLNGVDQTVAAWLQASVGMKRRTGAIRPRTADSYEQHIERFLAPGLGQHRLSELRSWHVQAFLDDLLRRGVGRSTVRSVQRTLSSALADARRRRLVAENEASASFLSLPVHRASRTKALEPNEIRRFVEHVQQRDSAAAALLLLALTTGMRNAELLGLAWDDVAFAAEGGARVHVRRVLQRVRDLNRDTLASTNGKLRRPRRYHVGEPKSAAGERWIEVPPPVVRFLSSEQARQRALAWPVLDVGDLVFRNRHAGPLSDASLNGLMADACRGAGIERRTFYALRHTAASVAIHVGETDVSMARLLGHADPGTTKRYYAQAFEEHGVALMTKMAALMFSEENLERTEQRR